MLEVGSTSRHRIRCLNLTLLLAAVSLSLSPPAHSASMQGKTVLLPAGTTLEGRIDTTIGSARSKEGKRFNISMSTPVLANGSEIVIPAGSVIIGEVVEALPSSHFPHKKHTPKPFGKLRVQLSGLRTPDGATYPLVGSLAPESYEQLGGMKRENENLGGGMGYIGNERTFDMAGMAGGGPNKRRGNQQERMTNRLAFMRDPLYGKDPSTLQNQNSGLAPRIRSLQIKNHDIYIDDGSPVSVRLDAPLKLTVSAGLAPQIAPLDEHPTRNSNGRKFNHDQEPQDDPNYVPGGLPFLRPPSQRVPQGATGVPQGAVPVPQVPAPVQRPSGTSDF